MVVFPLRMTPTIVNLLDGFIFWLAHRWIAFPQVSKSSCGIFSLLSCENPYTYKKQRPPHPQTILYTLCILWQDFFL